MKSLKTHKQVNKHLGITQVEQTMPIHMAQKTLKSNACIQHPVQGYYENTFNTVVIKHWLWF